MKPQTITWQKLCQIKPERGRKNQLIGQRQIACKQALEAETKQTIFDKILRVIR